MMRCFRNTLVFIAAVAVGVILADASRFVANTMVEFWEESKPEVSAKNNPLSVQANFVRSPLQQETPENGFKKKGYFYQLENKDIDKSYLGELMAIVISSYDTDTDSFGRLVFTGGDRVDDLDSPWRFWAIKDLNFVADKVRITTETQFGRTLTFEGSFNVQSGAKVDHLAIPLEGRLSLLKNGKLINSVSSGFKWEEHREKCFM